MVEKSKSSDNAMWDAYNRFHFMCDTHRFQKLVTRVEMVRMITDVPGDIVDAGAFKGVSTLQFAQMLEVYQPNSRAKVISLDTFEASFPHIRDDERDGESALMRDYEAGAYEQLSEAVQRLGLAHRVLILRGDIAETLPQYISDNPGFRIALLHCDLDAEEPTRETLSAAWPRVVKGGMVVFDEYAIENWGESDAADTFLGGLKDAPRLRTFPHSPTPTAYLIKENHGTSAP